MSELNKKIDEYIKNNPKGNGEIGYYKKVADIFGVHPEAIRSRWKRCGRPTHVGELKVDSNQVNFMQVDDITSPLIWTTTNSGTYVYGNVDESIESLDDLVRVCKIDTTKYNVDNYEIKSYNAWIKNKDKDIEKKQLYSVRANLKLKKLDTELPLQKQAILDEIKKYSIVPPKTYSTKGLYTQTQLNRHTALEINIPDLHIGKLAWAPETGDNYDIDIACQRYKDAIYDIISRVPTSTLEKIILPIGNDMLQVDNKAHTTTSGTHVSTDSRFAKMFLVAKNLLIETIDYLSDIAPVDVVVIPGNHDNATMFTLGEVISAWYHNNPSVTVDNGPTQRKYYTFGQNLIMWTHGNNEKLNDLGIICATEQPKMWADTKYRRCHIGHLHHSKQVKYTDVQEFPGFTVKIINSLSSNDAWHNEKGFISLKSAEAFLYHRDRGLLANYYHIK